MISICICFVSALAHTRLTFDTLDDVQNDLEGESAILSGRVAGALYLDGRTIITIGGGRTECFRDPDLCANGATFAFWLKWEDAVS